MLCWLAAVTPKEFKKLLARDLACLHCGRDDETLVPQHRINRQMGGAGKASKRNAPSNLIVLCSEFNARIEFDSPQAQIARLNGCKLSSWQNPLVVPVWSAPRNAWVLLDDSFGFVTVG